MSSPTRPAEWARLDQLKDLLGGSGSSRICSSILLPLNLADGKKITSSAPHLPTTKTESPPLPGGAGSLSSLPVLPAGLREGVCLTFPPVLRPHLALWDNQPACQQMSQRVLLSPTHLPVPAPHRHHPQVLPPTVRITLPTSGRLCYGAFLEHLPHVRTCLFQPPTG